ncbi:metallophosphoesterase [Clostridium saccharobutylicum]|uniref:Putative metallophosphoesterase n=1 Tax=Clostridium saccharobutylicum TaxID=169679 RepID=A0A1S8NJD7_CLOSA|nr:metallophosphoesterase [Clostridium saccharobutylicum]OOM16595.1 putative metallophosphoesterase [Clostridium saccharobutylicum]
MNNVKAIVVVFVILSLYIMLCYYIGAKGKNIFIKRNVKIKTKIYWSIYWFTILSFLIGSILRGILTIDNWFVSTVLLIGAVSIAVFIYSILLFLPVDLAILIIKRIRISQSIKYKLKRFYCGGISIFVIVFIIVGYGIWNAKNQVVTNYDVNINKASGQLDSLNVVMVSDVHMGIGIREKGIDKLVNSINELNPDIVLFCGDMVDESTPTKLKEYSTQAFKNIQSKYGVYDITGNHEYNSGDISKTISSFEEGNVKFLQDEAVKINDSFYIVGRNDPAGKRIDGQETKPLSDILKDADRSLPIIVLNHRPEKLQEAEEENVDLQLSGHTHKGQIFPGNIITGLLNEDDYGYMKKDDFNLMVSSGYGTWGPPLRIGTKGEIVNIKINFNKG